MLFSSLLVCGLQPLTPKLLFPEWLSSPELAALVLLSALETEACSGRLLMAILSVLNPFSPRCMLGGGVQPETGLFLAD